MDVIKLMSLFKTRIDGLLHVGANGGSEAGYYWQSGVRLCVFVEPISNVFAVLEQNIAPFPSFHAVRAICSERSGDRMSINIASNSGLSSSILPLGRHAVTFPGIDYVRTEEVSSRAVDDIVFVDFKDDLFNAMVLDVQGAEMHVLKGAERALAEIDAIFIEVSEVPLYEGGCTLVEIQDFLAERGFGIKWLQIMPGTRHGDAFFYRTERPIPSEPSVNLALGRPAAQSSISIYSTAEGARGGNNGGVSGRFGFHTELEKEPWWEVDLEEVRILSEVRVFNRLDTAAERAYTLNVLLSTDYRSWTIVYQNNGAPFGGADGRPLRVRLPGQAARFVRVMLDGVDRLHLDEIQVF